ncbi:hypothetical protein AB0J28_15925 [Streptosporangium canum]|uniref:hypothetical protein n=1 Tax=Streptosporangium canum TaxID=324952 RepID=UPI003417ECA0
MAGTPSPNGRRDHTSATASGWLPSTERSRLAEQPQQAKQTRAAARRAEVTGRAGQSARKEALEGVPAGATMRTCPSGCAS